MMHVATRVSGLGMLGVILGHIEGSLGEDESADDDETMDMMEHGDAVNLGGRVRGVDGAVTVQWLEDIFPGWLVWGFAFCFHEGGFFIVDAHYICVFPLRGGCGIGWTCAF